MGVYVYTLRKNTIKAIDSDTGAPIEIGITKYAYKCSYNDDAYYNRLTARQHAAADRARDANPNLVLVTFGDDGKPCKYTDDNRTIDVFRVKPTFTAFYDTEAPGELVGRLIKNGRNRIFERIAT